MIITLEFSIPEEREECSAAQRGGEYLARIEEARQLIRSKLKYMELVPETRQHLEEIRGIFDDV